MKPTKIVAVSGILFVFFCVLVWGVFEKQEDLQGTDGLGLINGLDQSGGTFLKKDGYKFTVSSTSTDFTINAEPINPGITGDRHFFADETGFIRSSIGSPADAESPIFEDARYLFNP